MSRSPQTYELIIAGAGPAGVTAAIYAARKKINFAVIADNVGGQVTSSSEIENYTGFQFISGAELSAKFEEHLQRFKFELKLEDIVKVTREEQLFRVKTDKGEYNSKTVIVATGRRPRELNVPGESEFKNRGITYCETCDGPLFEGFDIAIVGGGNSGLEAALQLMKIATHVYVINRGPNLKADPDYLDKVNKASNVEILNSTNVLAILGDKTVKGIKIRRKGKDEELLKVRGVFIEIGSVPNSQIVDFVNKNPSDEIIVNPRCETNIPGLFAAGDVTDVPEKQIIVAAGEGCKAAMSAFRYLSQA
jgi:alkyl hydroperoxide reductase subunit F